MSPIIHDNHLVNLTQKSSSKVHKQYLHFFSPLKMLPDLWMKSIQQLKIYVSALETEISVVLRNRAELS